MNIMIAIDYIEEAVLNSNQFPYRTGQLKNNFFDSALYEIEPNTYAVNVVSKKIVNYGKILQVAPTIRYGLKKNGYVYKYKKYNNRHFRYIDRCLDEAVRNYASEIDGTNVEYEP